MAERLSDEHLAALDEIVRWSTINRRAHALVHPPTLAALLDEARQSRPIVEAARTQAAAHQDWLFGGHRGDDLDAAYFDYIKACNATSKLSSAPAEDAAGPILDSGITPGPVESGVEGRTQDRVVDLMAALQSSVNAAKEARTRRLAESLGADCAVPVRNLATAATLMHARQEDTASGALRGSRALSSAMHHDWSADDVYDGPDGAA